MYQMPDQSGSETHCDTECFDNAFIVDELLTEAVYMLYKQPLHKVVSHLHRSIIKWNDSCREEDKIEMEAIVPMSTILTGFTQKIICEWLNGFENIGSFYVAGSSSHTEDSCEGCQSSFNPEVN